MESATFRTNPRVIYGLDSGEYFDSLLSQINDIAKIQNYRVDTNPQLLWLSPQRKRVDARVDLGLGAENAAHVASVSCGPEDQVLRLAQHLACF